MADRLSEFLVSATNTAPPTLQEAIRQLSNLSAGFCKSWTQSNFPEATKTSGEAFQLFDHIQNEILRQRDEKKKLPGWQTSPFKTALDKHVGEILPSVSPAQITAFKTLIIGEGALLPGANYDPLSLEMALNKLKHRGGSAVNFKVSPTGKHILYFFTNSGMGNNASISSFVVDDFCEACRIADAAI